MKKIFVLGLMLLLAAASSQAGVGTTGGNFLLMGGDARGLAMGGAQVALADSSSSVFWNPAGLARMHFPGLSYMYNQWFVDVKHQYFDFGYPTDNGTFGGSLSLLDSGDIQGYDAGGAKTTNIKATDSCLSGCWGRRINDRLTVGVGGKYLTESLENNQAVALALDAGLIFDLTSRMRIGAAIQNVGQPLKFISEDTPLPTTYRLGLGVQSPRFDDVISFAVDYANSAGNTPSLNVGAEYLFRGLIALRAGVSKGALRAGVGVRASRFGLDYAYLAHNELGAAHQVSMSYAFGSEDVRKARIKEYLTLGKAYYNEGRFAEAVVALEKVLNLDPENVDAKAMHTRAKRALETGVVEKVKEEIEVEKEQEVQVYLENGKKFMAEKQYLEAIAEFNKALRILPSHPETVKLIREAQSALEREVTEKVKEEAKEHLGLALKYIATENYEEAMREVDEVLKIDPGNVEALKLYKKLNKLLEIEKK